MELVTAVFSFAVFPVDRVSFAEELTLFPTEGPLPGRFDDARQLIVQQKLPGGDVCPFEA
jgi:hypothetical protein